MSPPEFAGKQLSAHKAPVWKKSPRTFQEVRTGAPLPYYCCSVGNKLTFQSYIHFKTTVLKTKSQNLTQMLASNKLHCKGDIFITRILKL